MNILILKHVNKYALFISLSFRTHALLITSDGRTSYKWFHLRVEHFCPTHHSTRKPTILVSIVGIFEVGGDVVKSNINSSRKKGPKGVKEEENKTLASKVKEK